MNKKLYFAIQVYTIIALTAVLYANEVPLWVCFTAGPLTLAAATFAHWYRHGRTAAPKDTPHHNRK